MDKVYPDATMLARYLVGDGDEYGLHEMYLNLDGSFKVVVGVGVFVELIGILKSVYGIPEFEIVEKIRYFLSVPEVEADRVAVCRGLGAMETGGSFLNVIHEAAVEWFGRDTFFLRQT